MAGRRELPARAGRGNRLSALIESARREDEERDEVYGDLFKEGSDDDDFVADGDEEDQFDDDFFDPEDSSEDDGEAQARVDEEDEGGAAKSSRQTRAGRQRAYRDPKAHRARASRAGNDDAGAESQIEKALERAIKAESDSDGSEGSSSRSRPSRRKSSSATSASATRETRDEEEKDESPADERGGKEGSEAEPRARLRNSTKRKRDVTERQKREREREEEMRRLERLKKPKVEVRKLTQEELLAEAARMEIVNQRSYELLLRSEEEKKREQRRQRPQYVGPTITYRSTKDGDTVTFSRMPLPAMFTASPPAKRVSLKCAMTGRPAKYIDPVTKKPYADMEAFKLMRAGHATIDEELHGQLGGIAVALADSARKAAE